MSHAIPAGLRLLVLVAAVALGAAIVGGQQPLAAASFTAAQAAQGRQIYDVSCAGCHRSDLGGGNEAPALSGVNFMTTWSTRPTRELSEFIQAAMPPEGPSLATEQVLALTAFILQTNGATPGQAPLAAGTPTPIGIAARAQAPGAAAPAAPAAQAAPAQAPGAAALPPGRGLTVPGNIQNYVPVTDAMLRNPPAGDWLMIRRNYQAWSHSPLTEITPSNVGRLKIAWVWAMNEGGASEPTPIVHNGIVYLYNTGNVVHDTLTAPGGVRI